jgi:ribosomal protein S18 acetylase RimI-like enzyme
MANIRIRLLGADEATVLAKVAEDVFDAAIDMRWCTEFFADARHHIAVALDGDTVVGFASAVHYVHPDKPPELWINEVGVAPSHQQRGIGKQLMQALLAHGRALGCRQAWVLTEDDNTAARALYAAAGGNEIERPVMVEFDLTE